MSGLRTWGNRRPQPSGRVAVRFRFAAPDGDPAGVRVLQALDADGRVVGNLEYQLCPVCREGLVGNIAVATHWQGRGVGREALSLVLATAPDARWVTSRQTTVGRKFFAAVEEETGTEFVEQGQRCAHMASAAETVNRRSAPGP